MYYVKIRVRTSTLVKNVFSYFQEVPHHPSASSSWSNCDSAKAKKVPSVSSASSASNVRGAMTANKVSSANRGGIKKRAFRIATGDVISGWWDFLVLNVSSSDGQCQRE